MGVDTNIPTISPISGCLIALINIGSIGKIHKYKINELHQNVPFGATVFASELLCRELKQNWIKILYYLEINLSLGVCHVNIEESAVRRRSICRD